MELAAWVQAGATVVLVGITAWYARSVSKQTEAARESADAAKKSAEATEHMARLQSQEVRRKTVPTLRDLKRDLRYLSSQLRGWRKDAPALDEPHTGPMGHLGVGKSDVQETQTKVSKLAVDDETRERLSETLDRVSAFREGVDGARQAMKREGADPSDLERLSEEFDAISERLEAAIDTVDGLYEEIR